LFSLTVVFTKYKYNKNRMRCQLWNSVSSWLFWIHLPCGREFDPELGLRGRAMNWTRWSIEGQACPSHLKKDVSLPDEPFLEMTLWKTSFFLFWVKAHGHRLCQGLKTPTSCVFFSKFSTHSLKKWNNPKQQRKG
jgi:hypothetical protein